MMDIAAKIRERARRQIRTIVFPESEDQRVSEAVKIINSEGFVRPILLSKDNLDEQKLKEYYQAAGSQQKNVELLPKTLFYAAMMVKQGEADGFVAGASNTTADVARAAFYCLGLDKRFSVMSSTFIMSVPNSAYGEDGILFFADCGIIPEPLPRQLAYIAISTAELAKKLFDLIPRVAILSYSTKGSASGKLVDRLKEAVALAKEKAPDLIIDGELQVDTAIVPEVARLKDPQGVIKGRANILIFPTLEAGNISYKLVQRLCNARAIGPIMQGVNFPCSDLSRGCSIEDVVDCAAITAIRAQNF